MRALLLDPFAAPFMARALTELTILGVLSGLVSVFVLLRRLAFTADALTHTVFPGSSSATWPQARTVSSPTRSPPGR